MKKIQTEWTATQLVRVTGISRTVIEQRLSRVKPIRETERERIYPAPECFRAVIKANRDDPAVQRLSTAKAEMAEMDLAVKRNELVKLSEVELVWTAAIISARQIICQSALSRKEQDDVLEQLASADHKQNLQKSNA
jgi:hypothetical protein